MSDPRPYLPAKFQNFCKTIKHKKINSKIVFIAIGILSTIWFLIRVVPKPSRAGYPCMRATAPIMSAFVLYLLSLGGSILFFKSFQKNLFRSKYMLAVLFLVLAASSFFISQTQLNLPAFSNIISQNTGNQFVANTPIGEAQGIFPGRVTWIYNPDATNENCTNTSNGNGVIDLDDDAWFMEKNNDIDVIDEMFSKSIMALTGEDDITSSWEKIFQYRNKKSGLGSIGYSNGQKVFIKLNATTAHNGVAGGRYDAELRRNDDIEVNPFSAETNPFLVLTILKHLVNIAGIPEDKIFIGDPARNIYKEFYELWKNEFPGINYLGNNLLHAELEIENLGRTPVEVTEDEKFFYSDNGEVMPDAISDKLFTIFDSIDYQINIPTMKAHSIAGITLAAKNHFGSFPRKWASHLHRGLMENVDNPVRLGYGLYRVQTDIMMHKLLSGKDLFMIVDGLYPSNEALGVPYKWNSLPFNNDWCSSIFMSLDPIAIESVCHDFLRTEYNGNTIAGSRPNWDGVDDYLRQAADSSLWPNAVIYDPDNDGVLYASLGVHEHWNDSINKQYSRNLNLENGIELIKLHEELNGVLEPEISLDISIYPNPCKDYLTITNGENEDLSFALVSLSGEIIFSGKIDKYFSHKIQLSNITSGVYLVKLNGIKGSHAVKVIKR